MGETAMTKVILYTSTNEFVVSGWVPKFDTPPTILIWGDRLFEYRTTDDEGVDLYSECFAVALVRVD